MPSHEVESKIPFKHIWNYLTDPSPSIQDPAVRSQIKILASILFVIGPLYTIASVAGIFYLVNLRGSSVLLEPFFYTNLAASLLMLVAYILSRTKAYQWGGYISLSVGFVAIVVSALLNPEYIEPTLAIISILPFIMVYSMFRSVLSTLYISIVVIVVMVVVVIFSPQLSMGSLLGALIFLALMTALILIAKRHREILEEEREEQLRQVMTLEANIREAQVRNAMLQEHADGMYKAMKAAREAEQIKTDFIANVSHELRTPLHAISGYCQLLLEDIAGTMDEQATHFVERIYVNSESLVTIVNDILDLSFTGSEEFQTLKQPFSPQELLVSLHRQLSRRAEEKSLAFELTLAADLPSTLIGDKQLIRRVVNSLLSNAFKFTEKGQVHLQAGVDGEKESWKICVSDTGVGMEPEVLEHIYEPFWQADSSITRQYGGTGLGLTIARQMVQMMNGEIEVKSTVGEGSVFTVTLPLVLDEEEEELVGVEEREKVEAEEAEAEESQKEKEEKKESITQPED